MTNETRNAARAGVFASLLALLGVLMQVAALYAAGEHEIWYHGAVPLLFGNIMLGCSCAVYSKGAGE